MHYTGPKCRKCRREGMKLFLKGVRCETPKCSVVRKNYPPGMHGKMFSKRTEYSKQLREKQKIKWIFSLNEKQLRNYYAKASKSKKNTADTLFGLLERRLDNIVYRSGMADSRSKARQMVIHGIFYVNGKKVNIPSYTVKVGDKIKVLKKEDKNRKKEKVHLKDKSPNWMKTDFKNLEIEIIKLPDEKDFEQNIERQLIIEYYSR